MFCRTCGAQMVDGAKFCPKCGTQAVVQPIVSQAVDPVAEASVVTPSVPSSDVEPMPAPVAPQPIQPPFVPPMYSSPLPTMPQPLYVPPMAPEIWPVSEEDKKRFASSFGSIALIVLNGFLTYFLYSLIALFTDDGTKAFVKLFGLAYRYMDFDDAGEAIGLMLGFSVILFFIGLTMVIVGLWITVIGGFSRSYGTVKGSAILTRVGAIFCGIFFYSMFVLYCIGILMVFSEYDAVTAFLTDEYVAYLLYSFFAMGAFLFTFALLSTQLSGMCRATAYNINLMNEGMYRPGVRQFYSEGGIIGTLVTMLVSYYSIPIVALIASEGEAEPNFGVADVLFIIVAILAMVAANSIAKKANEFKLTPM
ncbi:MAG: zinc-ribbon domain-containing protein [Clostridia bacterium]|nr:zinc-ribbon domain-containing protein [Clostridia bacterium]